MTQYKGPISAEQIADWRKERDNGMVSAVGEYTPSEFWELLDAYEALINAPQSRVSDDTLNEVWPPRDCVAALVRAATHLLDDHACDTDKHEDFIAARRVAERWLAAPHSGEAVAMYRQVPLDMGNGATLMSCCVEILPGADGLPDHTPLYAHPPITTGGCYRKCGGGSLDYCTVHSGLFIDNAATRCDAAPSAPVAAPVDHSNDCRMVQKPEGWFCEQHQSFACDEAPPSAAGDEREPWHPEVLWPDDKLVAALRADADCADVYQHPGQAALLRRAADFVERALSPTPAEGDKEAAEWVPEFSLLALGVSHAEYAARILDDAAVAMQQGIDTSVAEGCEYMDEDEQWSAEEARRQVAAYRLAAAALRGKLP